MEEILAMCKPKVIDLDKLGFADAILNLFVQGGGETAIPEHLAIFEELSGIRAGKPIIAKCSFAPLDSEFRTSNTCVVFSGLGTPLSFSFEVIVAYGDLKRVNVRVENNYINDSVGLRVIVMAV